MAQNVPQPPPDPMTFGDVLFRLALVAPDDYRLVERLARELFRQAWPLETDVLVLKTDLRHYQRP